jgi:hypothetical protein
MGDLLGYNLRLITEAKYKSKYELLSISVIAVLVVAVYRDYVWKLPC